MKTKLLLSFSLILLFLISNSVPAQWLTSSTSRIKKLNSNTVEGRKNLDPTGNPESFFPNINSQIATKGILTNGNGDQLAITPNLLPDDNRANVYVIPNNGFFSTNARSPQGSRLFVNERFLINGTEMTNSGFSGPVSTIGFTTYPEGAGAQSVATTGTLRIYLKDTTASAIALGTSVIDTSGQFGGTLVYNGPYNISTSASSILISVTTNGAFTPISGHGVIVTTVYKTTSTLATPIGSPGCLVNSGTGNRATLFQSQTANSQAGSFQANLPETVFGNSLVDAIAVGPIWALGQSAVCPCPDTNFVDIIFSHERAQTDTIILTTSIKNIPSGSIKFQYIDTAVITGTGLFILYRSYPKTSITKLDSIIAVGRITSQEDITGNNKATYLKQSTLNVYSNPQPNGVYAGRVGLGTAGDFVAGYYVPCAIPICAVKIVFNQLATFGSLPYKIKVWGNRGDTIPSVAPLYTSAQLTSPAGGASPQPVTHYLPTPVTVGPGYFYVGVEEIAGNLGIGYQIESPLRGGTFFLEIPANSNTWFDLSGNSANFFNVDMEAITTLNLTLGVWLQGYYNPPDPTVNTDTVSLVAHSFTSPYAVLDSAVGIARTDGTATFKFSKLDNTVNYYFAFRNRNHLETWTYSTGVKIDECDKFFDLRNVVSNTYGSNEYFQSPGLSSSGAGAYTIYGGDVDQDGFINGIDLNAVFNAASAFVTGYSVYDINGDQYVDLTDVSITYNNNTTFVQIARP